MGLLVLRATLREMSVKATALRELRDFAHEYRDRDRGPTAGDASVFLDERQDGEPVTRVVIGLDDPPEDTWEGAAVTDLRRALGTRATELELPAVSLTLVPSSEAGLLEDLPTA
jgi:hypothetical protein